VYQSGNQKIRINQQKIASELDLVRNQVHPIFLRNALQKLYILSRRKEPGLPEMVLSISEILNYMIFECDREFVRVERELTMLEHYLEFEKTYAGKDFNYQLVVHENARDFLISPYILFPIVRSIGAYHGSDDAIVLTVTFSILNNRFHILLIKEILHAPENISDTAWHSETELARRRLDLVYKHKYSLDIREKGQQVQMELYIDTNLHEPGNKN
jgi:LytS/YehU family sensor histidine kinase